MKDQTKKLEELQGLVEKIGRLYAARVLSAQEHFFSGIEKALQHQGPAPGDKPVNPWQDWLSYAADFAQRSVLFLDIMRERGNRYLAHVEEGQPPLLAFPWEMVCDGRTFPKPVNYALIRIIPPEGARVDDKKRPFIIIDPRAGHGPGIGGFKTDSEVGVALQFGYPVYFVIFFPEPEPGQTILDVCAVEDQFLKTVVSRHRHGRIRGSDFQDRGAYREVRRKHTAHPPCRGP